MALFPRSFLLLENKLISYAFHGGNCFEIQIWGNIDYDIIVFLSKMIKQFSKPVLHD